jgi:predicted nucleic acid-binding protein/GNAT superfamily N-acetyltransferase
MCSARGLMMDFRIVKARDDLSRFIDCIKKNADSERNAFGFLPKGVYDEALFQEKLLAAIGRKENSDDDICLGHLLYGGTFPNLKIFQVYVLPKYRKRHIGSLLVDHLINNAEKSGYLSISVRVAEDLKEANSFWEKKDFYFVRSVPGGATSRRIINKRVRDLDSPRLFASTPAQQETNLCLSQRLLPRPLTYVLDVNVLLDLVKQRPRADYVRQMINAALNHSIRVHITEEFLNELRRASKSDEADPILEFAASLPCFPKIKEACISSKCQDVAQLLFPENTKKERLSSNQKSDALHLATAIHFGAVDRANLVTSRRIGFEMIRLILDKGAASA